MNAAATETFPRPLTEKERELVSWLIEHGTSDDKKLLKLQVDLLTVCSKCKCGCPTIHFALDGIDVPGKDSRVISDYCGTVEGFDVGVMLFATDGQLGCLEAYSFAGHDDPFGLPEISSLRPVEEVFRNHS